MKNIFPIFFNCIYSSVIISSRSNTVTRRGLCLGIQPLGPSYFRELTDPGGSRFTFTYTSTCRQLPLRLRPHQGSSTKLRMELHPSPVRPHRPQFHKDQLREGLGPEIFQARDNVLPLLVRNTASPL